MFMYKTALVIEVLRVELAWQLQIRIKGFVCCKGMECAALRHTHLASMGVLVVKQFALSWENCQA